MLKRLLSLFIVISILVYSQTPVFAISVEEELALLKSRVADLERELKRQKSKTEKVERVANNAKRKVTNYIKYTPGEGVEVEYAGLNIGAGATFVAQGTPNANNAGDLEDSIFDASWSMDIEIEKEFDDWGLAFLHLETGQNDTIETELSVFSNVNRDADASEAAVSVTEVWYEHYFFDKQLTVTGGKIDATCYMDQNEYANDECAQFLGHIFRNSPVIEWPTDNNWGFRAIASPSALSFLEFETGYFEADGDWDDVFDHAFRMAQINLKPAELFEDVDSEKWGGNYRFYSWINGQDHAELVDEGDTASNDTKEINYGFGFSFDQMVTDVFGLFTRFGWQRGDISLVDESATVDWSWSAGAQMTGKYWNREDDVLAFAIGQVFPSDEWNDSSSDNYGAGEGHIETYYKCQINECLAISPDLQIIWNPNGVSREAQGDDDTIICLWCKRTGGFLAGRL